MAKKKAGARDVDEEALKATHDALDSHVNRLDGHIHFTTFAETAHPPIPSVTKAQISTATGAIVSVDADGNRKSEKGIVLNRAIKFQQFLKKPYKDVQLARHEGAVRRNWAIQTAISVREFFMFAEPSELIIDLPNSEAINMNENEKQDLIEVLKEKTAGTDIDIENIIKKAHTRDDRLHLLEKLRVMYWQCLIFGDGYVVKIFEGGAKGEEGKQDIKADDDTNITRLYPINSRRVTDLIADEENTMEIEGVWIDGQALDIHSTLHFHYQQNQISPHSEGYGYTPLETVLNLAEGLNIFYEEDVKEIQRSAWLSSILLNINTAGLNTSQSAARIKKIVDSIDPGKIIGVGGQGENGVVPTPLDLKSDLAGLAQIGENQEAKIFKSFRVPQFLVQSEDIANRATSDKSSELFLTGVIGADQTWLSQSLERQWYEPFLREELGLKEGEKLPFRLVRKFKVPTVSEFVDLAQGLTQLVGGGIWDIEEANKKLGTPEVADRLASQEDMMMPPMPGAGAPPGSPQGKPNTPGVNPFAPQVKSGKQDLGEAIKDKDKKGVAAALAAISYKKGKKKPTVSSKQLGDEIRKKKLEMLDSVTAALERANRDA